MASQLQMNSQSVLNLQPRPYANRTILLDKITSNEVSHSDDDPTGLSVILGSTKSRRRDIQRNSLSESKFIELKPSAFVLPSLT